MRPDGSGRRLVAGGIFANGNYTWSPDGKWIVISGALPTPQNPFAIGLTVINVESGEVLPLHMSRTILQPSWRPVDPSQ
jgi:Tol biopolymer transport system component